VSWPFKNCANNSPVQVSAVNMDSKPTKGSPAGINIQGSVNSAVTLKQVQIVTALNGTPLNTQYDSNNNSFKQGAAFNYRFAVTIPGFAPSVIFLLF